MKIVLKVLRKLILLAKFLILINKMNTKIKVKLNGAINAFRHMKISDLLKLHPNLSYEQKLELSAKMGHSLSVQRDYERLNISKL